jgi:putative DNA primase/helicase
METSFNLLKIKVENIPSELRALPQWVCWRLEQDKRSGRDCKVPYSPRDSHRASPNNPATWGTLDEALNCAEKYLFSGIGFMFTAESGINGIDLDHCLVLQL